MAKHYLIMSLLLSLTACFGDKPYDEHANANTVIKLAADEAKQQHKPLVIIFGANWCPDCQALNKNMEQGKDAQKFASDFKIVKVNVGNFDKNIDVANAYGNPIAGGIPGAAILSAERKLLYVTKPGELSNAMRNGEHGVYAFLLAQVKTAMNPSQQ